MKLQTKRIRLECLVTGRKIVMEPATHKNVLVHKFSKRIVRCRNTTDIIKKLYSIGWIGVWRKIQFSETAKCFINIFFGQTQMKLQHMLTTKRQIFPIWQIDEKIKAAEAKEQSS